jgi:hypothetical protein
MDYWDFHGAGMQGTVAGSSEHVRRMNKRPRVSLREFCAFLRQLAGQRLDVNIGAQRNNLEIIYLNAWHGVGAMAVIVGLTLSMLRIQFKKSN